VVKLAPAAARLRARGAANAATAVPGVPLLTMAIRGIPSDRTLRARVAKQMAAVLAPLRVTPVSAQVIFFDENGPKGGVSIRCALTVRLPYRPTVRVEQMGEAPAAGTFVKGRQEVNYIG